MFEGKNLHFSPADNKPLCSYSSKLCRQRRLNGYAFCIRHILEDKSAPFKRCTYVTRNNNQICQNAIPTSQERGYCHSHMQVAGIIPKTERKIKNPPASKVTDSSKSDSSSNSSNKKGNSAGVKSSSAAAINIVKKDPNAVFKFEEEPAEIQWIPKGGSINGIVNGGKVTASKGKDLQILKKEVKGNGIVNGKALNGSRCTDSSFKTSNISSRKIEAKNGMLNHSLSNGFGQSLFASEEKTSPTAKCRQTYGKRPNNKSISPEKPKIIPTTLAAKAVSTVVELSNLTPPPAPNTVKSVSKITAEKKPPQKEVPLPVDIPSSPCAPENVKYFDQFKTLKSVEKYVSDDSCSKDPNVTSNLSSIENLKPTNSLKTISTFPKPTQESKANTRISSRISSIGSCSSPVVDLFNSITAQKDTLIPLPILSHPDNCLTPRNGESRQEFLARVRHAFKSQYLTIRNSAVDSDKNEKIWKRALRNSLLTCVVKDSFHCAHVIAENDPKKYSAFNENTVVSKPSPNLKHKKPVNNGKGKQGKKNGVIDDSDLKPDAKSSSLKPEPNLFNKTLNGKNSPMVLTDIGYSNNLKSSNKRNSSATSSPEKEKVVKVAQSKKKGGRKLADTNHNSTFINGIDKSKLDSLSLSHHSQSRSISSYKSSSTIDFDDIVQASNAKKRKCDEMNGDDSKPIVDTCPSITFRIPKIDESSSLNDMDTNHGQVAYNSFNGHISNHHPLLHPHSGSATTSLKAPLSNAQVQLQHLLNQPDLRTLASNTKRNHGMDTVLNSVGSSDMGTSDGVITDASFDSTFDHSVSSQPDCEFSDDDLEKSLEFQIDPETEHQASRLLEDNELTEDDLNELFPETSNKLGRSDLSDLGDFSSAFDANDIDYSLFANIFPFSRSSVSESISVSNQY